MPLESIIVTPDMLMTTFLAPELMISCIVLRRASSPEPMVILDLSGKITIGSGEEALRNTMQEIMSSGARKVVINMSGVTMIDSSGIGEMVSAYTTATNRGDRKE